MVAPFIGEVHLEPYLQKGVIEEVTAGGENYEGARILRYEWVKKLYEECVRNHVTFEFFETGTRFEKDGKVYDMPDRQVRRRMAYQSRFEL